ncbi:MAG: response regulator [Candidatus Binatia bacterium]
MNQFWPDDDDGSRSRLTRAPLLGVSVLVVEDDALSREGLSLVLESYGAEVSSVSNAPAALETLDDTHPSVLISDIGLPGEDGLRLIRRIRMDEHSSPRRLPAIALSGFSDPALPGISVSAGFDCFLAKPVDIPALIAAVARLVASRRASL